MNGLDLYLLGRTLMKLGEESMLRAGQSDLTANLRLVLGDVFEHPGTTVGEVVARTGLPQSHVSAAIARFARAGALVVRQDPADRRRTLVSPSQRLQQLAESDDAPDALADPVIWEAIRAGSEEATAAELRRVMAALSLLADELPPTSLAAVRTS